MELTNRQSILLAYSSLRDFYQTQITDQALAIYADDLEDLEAAQVVAALRTLRREPGRRTIPLPTDVRAIACAQDDPVEEQACLLAGRVMESIGKFGYMRPSKAREWLGEDGWQIVVAKGGWHTLCANTMSGENAFFAQCRDLAKGIIGKRWRMEQRQFATQGLHPANLGTSAPTPISATLANIQKQIAPAKK